MAINSNAIPKNIKARTVLKTGTEEEWEKAKDFIPLKGEPIIWDVLEKNSSGQYTTPRKIIARKMKVGDGQKTVITLPYVNVEESAEITFEEYPVGFLFVSKSSTTPDERGLKGDWEAIPAGSTIIGAGDGYSVESTGGAATVTLTTDQMPAHSHEQKIGTSTSAAQIMASAGGTASGYAVNMNSLVALNGGATHTTTYYSGGDASHNNMPPYKAFYMWIRIA